MSEPCTRYLEELSGYLDGELPEEDVRALESHLAECADCRLALEEMRAVDARMREAIKGKPESSTETQALERTLARLREEPAPAGAARPRRRWSWSVTLRWSAGIAAAAAAVLLVMRLGPSPTAPIRTRAIAPSQEVAAPATPAPAAPAPTAPAPAAQTPAPQLADRTQEVAKAKQQAPVRVQTTKAAPQTAEREAPPQSPPQTEEPKASEPTANIETDVVLRDQVKSGAGEPSPSAPAPAPTRPESHGARQTPPERGAATAERAPTPSPTQKDGSILGRVKSTLSGGAVRTLDRPSAAYFNETAPAEPWYMTVAPGDTILADVTWFIRLRDAEIEMVSRESARLPADERARRYRTIGDLWEWYGRTAGDPFASQHALASYAQAVKSDAQAAALDSTRVQRARTAVVGLMKVTPAYR